MKIKIMRIYEEASAADGWRVFVDRLWQRGVCKEEAKELADRYFLETLVQVHRAGEGAPYTGLKAEPVAQIVAIADQALVAGSAEEMITKMTGHMAGAIREKFNRALETKKHAGESVAAGREYVEAYVQYMHYV